ncbi:F-box only protein 9 isoform X2 [Ixodes scapularis]|uniref:F-box only protein 9 isoform X2 n=1 Tax=Ixodes scapularis TaxID=6945 RepID=UPI001C37F91E|nr:F-box only protein 9 isoform X2 [Ixodes scapularis]
MDNQPSTVKSSTPSNNQSGVDNADSAAEEGEDEEASSHNSEKELRLFEKAKQLYLKGVLAERSGRMYDAISYYRQALQKVPDIEFRLTDSSVWSFDEESDSSDVDCKTEESPCSDDDMLPLHHRIRVKHPSADICNVACEQRATHLSDLPREVFMYILRWVVSSELDVLSLESVSRVCRGFYLCARDPELWHLVCARTWGRDCGQLLRYQSWREMYIYRPRICYNGVYINKTTYVRHGESSFQDSSYRPCFLVEYFRYLRFFPEGAVLMLTTPDNPYLSLGKLRSRRPLYSSVLTGKFWLEGTKLRAVLKKAASAKGTGRSANSSHRRSRPLVLDQQPHPEQVFHMELELRAVRGRPNIQLAWRSYAIHTFWSGQETVAKFDLTANAFPPLWFSRVKSFTSVSECPL